MVLEDAITNARREIPGCVALGLIDLSTGAVLCGTPLEGGGFDLAAAACGKLAWTAAPDGHSDSRHAEAGGRPDGNARETFREALVVGEDQVCVFLRPPSRASCAYIAVCASSIGLGIVLAKVRASLGAIDSAILKTLDLDDEAKGESPEPAPFDVPRPPPREGS
jgi:hypothetical protein